MVKLNCAAFPQQMIESELFGYVKGAFTGASNDFPGMIAEANGGTLFLDEISEMPAELQTRFLRVLQEREYRSLGSTRTVTANFRVVAATNRPIQQALAENRLRSDLYYRLNTFQIEVPPLRERKQDIPPLVGAFVKRFSQQLGKPEPKSSPEAFQKLLDYSWPGNCTRAAKRHRVRGRSRAAKLDHSEGIADRSSNSRQLCKIWRLPTRKMQNHKASMRWSATPYSRRWLQLTATKNAPRCFSVSNGRRFITK